MAKWKWRQRYRNSCGAACLLCAAKELSVAAIPVNQGYALWKNAPEPLALSEACEKRLYQVTSVHSRLGANPQSWGINLPSNIVLCARMLGLKAKVIAYDTYTVGRLKRVFSDEMPKLAGMHALETSSSSHSTFRPNPRQRELKVLVDRRSGNMHYVMVRPDGTVMDPGMGVDVDDIQKAKKHANMHGTGLSVFVQQR
jgi:hypothetical protein